MPSDFVSQMPPDESLLALFATPAIHTVHDLVPWQPALPTQPAGGPGCSQGIPIMCHLCPQDGFNVGHLIINIFPPFIAPLLVMALDQVMEAVVHRVQEI